MKYIRKTKSLCPHCLEQIDAVLYEENNEILLVKTCSKHGTYSNAVWRGKPKFEDWIQRHDAHMPKLMPLQISKKSCPHNCGICAEHKQSSCTVLLEITSSCNLSCPLCFANSSKEKENFQSLDYFVNQLNWIAKNAGKIILQISGGEPTLYPYLPELIEEATKLFPAVQLNTNGILLAKDKELALKLKKAGLSWVFLQFDAPCDEVNMQLRGKKLLDIKKKAIEHCTKANLSIVLVSTVAKGINDNKIRDLLDFSLEHFPIVRGIHFQPMTKSGRYLLNEEIEHITLPEMLVKLAEQSKGRINIEHASSSDCEHSLCSFHARYFVDKDLNLQNIKADTQKNEIHSELAQQLKENAPDRSVDSVIRAWLREDEQNKPASTKIKGLEALDDFIEKSKKQIFSITCMAFQDIHTIDLERLQECCIHIYAHKDGKDRLIPFCAYNLTYENNKALYR